MKIRTSVVVLLVSLPLLYLYSYFLISSYLYGDQLNYRLLYQALANASASNVIRISRSLISAHDGLSFYILWVGAQIGISKNVFIALCNVLMLILLYNLARRHHANYSMITLLLINYYIIVLMTGAERLKFAFIFLLLAASSRQRRYTILMLVAAIFAHMESILFVLSSVAGKLTASIDPRYLRRLHWRQITKLLLILVSFVLILMYKSDGILDKVNSYMKINLAFVDTGPAILFTLVGSVFIRRKILFIASLTPLIIVILFIGAIRVNMIVFMIGVYLYWLEGKSNHPLLYLMMFYFAIKGLLIMHDVVVFGTGYPTA